MAGLFAVLAHSLVDFGLETLGVLLPFVAVLAIVFGRIETGEEKNADRGRKAWLVSVTAFVCLAFGFGSVAHASYDDFDALLRRRASRGRAARTARPRAAHASDGLLLRPRLRAAAADGGAGRRAVSPPARAQPRAPPLSLLRAGPSGDRPELVARRPAQTGVARVAHHGRPAAALFAPALAELFAAGAKPEELTAIATTNPARIVEVAAFLGNNGHVADAFTVLDQADALGAPTSERMLMRARLQVQSHQTDAARATLTSARQAGTDDPRLGVLEAQLLLDTKGAAGADDALAILDAAASRYPHDLAIQRMRMKVILNHEKWKAAARALDGFKLALYQAQGSAAEAHAAGAQIEARLGRIGAAMTGYRAALADDPMNVTLWMEFARTAETGGRYSTAFEAYSRAALLSPKNPQIEEALQGLQQRNAALRGSMMHQTGLPAAGP